MSMPLLKELKNKILELENAINTLNNDVNKRAKSLYEKAMATTEKYTFPTETAVYLVIGYTNGNNYCIMDIVYTKSTKALYSTRIKDASNIEITYSDMTVTFAPTYTTYFKILKL